MDEIKNKSIGEKIADAFTVENMAVCFAQEQKENIRLGVEIAAVRNSFYYKALIEFLKGNDETSGSMYFCNLKPLFDKYGYAKVINTLLELEKEINTNE